MSEEYEIFRGRIDISLEDVASVYLEEIRDKTRDAFHGAEVAVRDFADTVQSAAYPVEKFATELRELALGAEQTKLGTNELKDALRESGRATGEMGQALEMAFEAPRKSLSEMVSQARFGFRQVTEDGGNAVIGVQNIAYAVADVAERFEVLRGVSGVVRSVGDFASNAAKTFMQFGYAVGSSTKDMYVLARRANDVTQAIRIQSIAWQESQRRATEAQKDQVKMLQLLKKTLEEAATVEDMQQAEIVLERFKNTYQGVAQAIGINEPFGVFAGNLSKARERAEQLIVPIQRIQEQINLTDRVQSKVATRITGSIQTLGQTLNYVTSNLQVGSREFTRYTARAKNTARRIASEIKIYERLGGAIDENITKSFKEASGIVYAIDAAQKKYNKEQKKTGKAAQQAGKGMTGYANNVRDAARANEFLMQYVRPDGAMVRGVGMFGDQTSVAAQQANRLSISLGSVISMASALGGALGQIDPAFSAIIIGVAQLADQFSRSFAAMVSTTGTSAQKIEAMIAIISNSLMALGLMATGAMVKMGMLAAQVVTAEITLTQIARNLADEAGVSADRLAKYVLELRDALVDTGITTREATDAMTQFLRLKLPVEKVAELGQAAQDLGVTVAHMGSSEVFGQFVWFLQSANSQLLRQLGITTTANQMYERYAKTIGKTAQTLNDYEKALARIEGILHEATTVTGVYDEAQKSAGKALSSMKRLFEQVQLTIGQRFEPTLAKLIFGMNRLLEAFIALPDSTKDLIADVIKWTAVFGSLLGITLALYPALKALIPVVFSLGKQIAIAMPWLFAIGAALAGLVSLGMAIQRAWKKDFAGIATIFKGFFGSIKADLKPLVEEAKYWIGVVRDEFGDLVKDLSEALKPVLRNIVSFLVTLRKAWVQNLGGLRDIIRGFFEVVRGLMRAFRAFINKDQKAMQKEIEDAVLNLFTVIVIIVKDWVAKAAVWGWNLVVSMAQGMWEAAQRVFVKTFKAIGTLIGSFFAGKSPPEKGPLQHIEKWGRGIMETFLRAFGLADFSVLRDVMAPIQKALEDAVVFGTIGEMDVVPKIREIRTAVAGLLADFRQTGKINEEVFNNIKAQLGEAGADFAEYIRLVLRHQQAVKALEDVQQEVAAAERAGFVPQELRRRLEAAEQEVSAAEQAVQWQKEFIAAQQDTIDLQIRQLKLLERMANAMEKLSGAAGADEEEWKFQIDIPDEDEITEMGEEVRQTFGGLSEDFLKLKQQIKDFLDLPIEEKLKLILNELLKLADFEFPEEWEEMNLGERLGYLFDKAIEYLRENLPTWISDLKTQFKRWLTDSVDALIDDDSVIARIASAILEVTRKAIILLDKDEHRISMGKRLSNWFERVIDRWLLENNVVAETWGYKIGASFGVIWGKFLRFLWITLPQFILGLFKWWYVDVLGGLIEWLSDERNIAEKAKDLLEWYFKMWDKWVEFLGNVITKFIWPLVEFFGDVIEGFVVAAVENAPDWIGDMWKVGAAVIDKLKEGISGALPDLFSWFNEKVLQPLKDKLPFSEPKDRSSPLYGLEEAGQSIIKNLAEGLRGVDLSGSFNAALTAIPSGLVGAGQAMSSSTQVFQYGAFYGAFPNVRTPEDAKGIIDVINNQVIKGRTMGMIGGRGG